IPNQMGWRVGVTSGCSKYGISHIEQQRKVIYINNLIIFIVFIIFHNVTYDTAFRLPQNQASVDAVIE
ncbi:MAG: hypothetical protein IJ899_05885, partial [Blautia sp.]|nr:hypothetical protein [Blautia sp.]